MITSISADEHFDRIRRVQSVLCPLCGAGKGQACKTPTGGRAESHHGARYAALYKRKAARK